MEVNNEEDKIKVMLDETKSILNDVSDYELSMISNSMRLVSSAPPSTKLQITERITSLIKSKSDIQYLVYRVKEIRQEVSIPYNNKYNELYTMLTIKGRPSKAAIESEMYFKNKDVMNSKNKLDKIDNLLEFLESYLNYLDRMISVLDSRRYDL